ncbi:hypothetical protein DWB77_07527 [Streptomyces hundungensis]|uniref:Uncharacterized protein n=1 Tax=Streptomyces hundungensis TaxID=1077946 RepID=A0A387HBE6_9ACTN|nr:hypothetical protein DWB77_00065 [Streptomyces hundungensis]AYG85310.1 hypothetical protein DWB77_07527 [Streptomyces hundungensis]
MIFYGGVVVERGMDLRTLFSTNDRALRAEEAFTNRQAQWQIIAEALAEHLHTISLPGFDVEDLEAARRNVVALHGVGGVGKTALSRTVEAALADTSRRPAQWGAPPWPEQVRILPVRIDLARSEGIDFERVVLLLRLALAATGRPMPAFDLTLRRYWENAHPGEPLEEYLRRSGLLAQFGKVLPQQMEGVLGEVAQALLLPGIVGSAVGKVTGALVTALRERRQAVRALAGCTRLADLLEAEPTLDALSFYPHLLSWDISQLPAKQRVVPVVLFDTWEEIGDRTHATWSAFCRGSSGSCRRPSSSSLDAPASSGVMSVWRASSTGRGRPPGPDSPPAPCRPRVPRPPDLRHRRRAGRS